MAGECRWWTDRFGDSELCIAPRDPIAPCATVVMAPRFRNASQVAHPARHGEILNLPRYVCCNITGKLRCARVGNESRNPG